MKTTYCKVSRIALDAKQVKQSSYRYTSTRSTLQILLCWNVIDVVLNNVNEIVTSKAIVIPNVQHDAKFPLKENKQAKTIYNNVLY